MVTIHDVAERAGVSATTVSHVINQTRRVSADLRDRVLLAMDELGYQPNALARSLRRKQTFTIGLVIPDNANPFFAEMARGIEDEAYALGYSVILCNSDGNLVREAHALELLLKRQVDGIILAPAGESASTVNMLNQRGTALVVIDRELPGIAADCILADHEAGARAAVEHLLALGHKRIGCISGPAEVASSLARVEGYRAALRSAGLRADPALVVAGNFSDGSGHGGAQQLLGMAEPPTAIFACNDLMAIGAIAAVVEMGLLVPDDISVVGYDDIHLAAFVNPPLTSVAQPKYDLGKSATALLVARLGDRSLPPRRFVLQNRLILRRSTAARK